MALLDIGTIYNSTDSSEIFVRFQAAALIAAKDIKAEDPQTPLHEQRVSWADAMLSGELNNVVFRVRRHLRYAIASNAAFQSSGTAITDGDIQFIVNSNINVLL